MKLTNSLGYSINAVPPIRYALKKDQVSAIHKVRKLTFFFKVSSVFNSFLYAAFIKEAASR
ncbi:MAG: hypothetical protein OEY22_06840 [Candidatus Bathyarchaeota archaeon]|nr:hypothetical protein [Candidatus Bathyarchaeota archaeon]MDH5788441.1 hypothetical protein [Candidatus Bathyarchaeota archaeon]